MQFLPLFLKFFLAKDAFLKHFFANLECGIYPGIDQASCLISIRLIKKLSTIVAYVCIISYRVFFENNRQTN